MESTGMSFRKLSEIISRRDFHQKRETRGLNKRDGLSNCDRKERLSWNGHVQHALEGDAGPVLLVVRDRDLIDHAAFG
jgi:hypothetical protein